ncbi:polymorphic toxin-type HINT domain-containing protein [Streptomyces kasugaensis]|uniref:polymorphic toxin-type HINT domain-containing protein n=3 Tax=Streptomyces TaxID=1883 RepID=UPI001559BD97|nr:polymorphic toxin-type HINT domain-containing protein [Streptomyces kasugaensis]
MSTLRNWWPQRQRWRTTVAVVFLAMLVSLIGATSPAEAKQGSPDLPGLQRERPVAGKNFTGRHKPHKNNEADRPWQTPDPKLPSGHATVDFTDPGPAAPRDGKQDAQAQAGELPVYASPAEAPTKNRAKALRSPAASGIPDSELDGVKVDMLDAKAAAQLGADGPVVKLTGTVGANENDDQRDRAARTPDAPAESDTKVAGKPDDTSAGQAADGQEANSSDGEGESTKDGATDRSQAIPPSVPRSAPNTGRATDAKQATATSQGQRAPPQKVNVALDYSAYSHLYGGDWGSRLKLVQLPACAATDPSRAECAKPTEIESRNDSAGQRLTARVALSAGQPLMLAAAAGGGGSTGDFGATALSPSGSWAAGGHAGGFSWTHPIETPDVPGGAEPEISLGYSSQSIDGRTASTNNQSSWIGEGWDYQPGFIERRYKSCSQDMGKDANNKTKTGDLCWFADSLTVSLDGSANELVRDDKTGIWKTADDDGARVELKKGAANGDNDGEHWVLTTTDGTQYWFGLNRLPGWSAGKPETNSTLTVPVFGNHPGEPCHADTFDKSGCTQAYRWNLDYVVDPHGDAMSLWWAKDTNHYGQLGNADKPVRYDRDGYLTRIDYGQRADSLFSAKAAARVHFTTAERCLPSKDFDCTGNKLTKENAKHWPDVPFDLKCDAGTKCTNKLSPSFWTTKRLTKITTEALVGDAYAKADSWELKHQFPQTDGTSPALWLASITRTGHAEGKDTTLPPVTFRGEMMDNRVDGFEGLEPFSRYRIHAVDTEHGSTIGVTYSARECSVMPGNKKLPTSPQDNGMRCYPTYWTPEWADKPLLDWFHKYVVTEIREEDNVTDALPKVTSYQYLGSPAWAYDDGELTEDKHRTWSQYRGYAKVRTYTGREDEGKRSMTEELYFRGMDGDHLPDGKRRSVQVTDSEGGTIADSPAFTGQLREQLTFLDEDSRLDSATKLTPASQVTAVRARPGTTALEARMGHPQTNEHRERQSDGSWQRTKEATTYDEYGQPSQTHDFGDLDNPDDDACTTLTYARNTDKWILELESQEKTVTGDCGASGGTTVSDTRTYYDGGKLGSAPAKGDVTSVEEMTGDGKGHQVAERTEYDVHGRPTASWDVDGNKTATAYTPAKGAIPTKTVVTNPLGHSETTHADPASGMTTAVVDANDRRRDMEYDGLGRLVKVWDINRDKAKGQSPSAEYEYRVTKTTPSTTLTRALKDNGQYSTTVEIFDGMLRQRQSQDPGVGGGRLITDTVHNTQGLVVKSNDAYFADGDVSETLLIVGDNKVPHQTVVTYDGYGRPVKEVTRRYGDDQQTTTAEYKGANESTVFPPNGDTVKTTFTDDEGRTTKLREYLNADRSKWNDTSYAYDHKGQLTKVTDPDGNNWTFEYDARGRQIKATDPDAGSTTTTYDQDDRPVTVTDARGKKVSTTYDALDRPTSLREGGPDGPKLAEWTYDSLLKGLPSAAIRHHGGKEYRSEVTGYDHAYQPTGSQTVIPDSEGKLAGTYAYEHGYTKETGLPFWTKAPAVGPLKQERISTRYNGDDLPIALGGLSVYASNLQYSASGELLRSEAGVQGKKVYSTSFYDEHTRRLTRTVHDRDSKDTKNSRIDDTNYTYDPAGNITKIARIPGASMPDGGQPDTQCFTYDALRRMTGAWTATDACAKAPSQATVGGPQPYWHSYGYDAVGNRTELVEHDTGGDTAKDVTRTYSYPGKGKDQPRTLTKVETKGPDGTSASTYAYDAAGNMTLRQVGGNIQKLAYDTEGGLAKITEGEQTTENLYDADGERLIHRAADGSTTLYLGDTELTVDKDGKLATTRYYGHPDGAVTVRTATEGDGTGGNGRLDLQLTDHHGSGTTQIGLGQEGLPVERRLLTPFGTNRGAKPSAWAGNRSFVGGREDEHTGLTQLGAREYDPTTGRFTSVDPVIDFGIPQQMNPYAYANNAPVTESDPDGNFFPIVIGIIARVAIQAAVRAAVREAAKRAAVAAARAAAKRAAAAALKRRLAAEAAKRAAAAAARKRAAQAAAARARAAAARKLAQRVAKKAKPRTAAKSAPKRAAKYRSAPKQRPKPKAKPQARPKQTPKPKHAKPQGSRQVKQQIKHEVKQEVKEQAKEQVREAAQPQGCPTPNSFVPGTTVLMADGTHKPIEEIKTGDKVLATDPETGKAKAEPVVATIIGNGSKDLVKITVRADGDKGGEQADSGALIATDGHPFWVPDLKKWLDAGDLKPGMWLQTSSGTWVQVSAVQAWTQNATVHNLTVESTYTYHVAAGNAPVLVHNTNCSPSQQLSDRASQIHAQAGSDIARGHSTVAVVRARSPLGSVDVVAGSGNGLNRTQKGMLRRGEILADNIKGTHAEQNALLFINRMGWSPIAGGASRSVCSNVCAPLIRSSGGKISGRVYPREKGTQIRTFHW